MEKTRITENTEPEYDYVIVGGGTAGCVLANRLSEDTSRTVLLLEAGPDDQDFPDIHVPEKWPTLQQTPIDWAYKTVPQQHSCKGLDNRQMLIPQGRVLGGSGSLNALVYCRGTPQDFDLWEKMGCEGWGYEQILPYFIKSEKSTIMEKGVRGTEGPMPVIECSDSYISEAFIKAGLELGYKETDINGRFPIGVMKPQLNTDDGTRSHTARAFLRPAMGRDNLHIATNCQVTKIIVKNGIARAVEFTRLSKMESVSAKREIILSAGTIGSAHLLLLSGIGPRQHLEEIGIPVVADLPVGEALQNHMMIHGIEFKLDSPPQGGPLSTNLVDGIGFMRSPSQNVEDMNPALQICVLPILQDTGFQQGVGLRKDFWDTMYPDREEGLGPGMSFFPLVSHPKSKGTLRLKSSHPDDYPLIDPQYLSHPDDVKTLVEGIKICLQFGKAVAFKSLGAKLIEKALPGYQGTPYTDAFWEEFTRTVSPISYHLVGTCRMGRADDTTTVTDPQLRVHGVGHLRVADASIIPEITTGNTNAPVVMLAEKAADMIKLVSKVSQTKSYLENK